MLFSLNGAAFDLLFSIKIQIWWMIIFWSFTWQENVYFGGSIMLGRSLSITAALQVSETVSWLSPPTNSVEFISLFRSICRRNRFPITWTTFSDAVKRFSKMKESLLKIPSSETKQATSPPLTFLAVKAGWTVAFPGRLTCRDSRSGSFPNYVSRDASQY